MNTIPTGWVPGRGSPFDRYIGPFYYPPGSSMDECGFITDERHSNTRGVVHGAMISPAFDLALGNASWAAAGKCACTTVQLVLLQTADRPRSG